MYGIYLDTVQFFTKFFYPDSGHAPSGDTQFGNLYDVVLTGGGGAYRIAFMVCVFAAVICFMLAIVDFFWTNGRDRAQAKAKVVRDVWVIIGIGCMASVLAVIFKAFSWKF